VILFKTDGSLCVHADKGYKPPNYNLATGRRIGLAD
jgi:RecB family endonuclease NucS